MPSWLGSKAERIQTFDPLALPSQTSTSSPSEAGPSTVPPSPAKSARSAARHPRPYRGVQQQHRQEQGNSRHAAREDGWRGEVEGKEDEDDDGDDIETEADSTSPRFLPDPSALFDGLFRPQRRHHGTLLTRARRVFEEDEDEHRLLHKLNANGDHYRWEDDDNPLDSRPSASSLSPLALHPPRLAAPENPEPVKPPVLGQSVPGETDDGWYDDQDGKRFGDGGNMAESARSRARGDDGPVTTAAVEGRNPTRDTHKGLAGCHLQREKVVSAVKVPSSVLPTADPADAPVIHLEDEQHAASRAEGGLSESGASGSSPSPSAGIQDDDTLSEEEFHYPRQPGSASPSPSPLDDETGDDTATLPKGFVDAIQIAATTVGGQRTSSAHPQPSQPEDSLFDQWNSALPHLYQPEAERERIEGDLAEKSLTRQSAKTADSRSNEVTTAPDLRDSQQREQQGHSAASVPENGPTKTGIPWSLGQPSVKPVRGTPLTKNYDSDFPPLNEAVSPPGSRVASKSNPTSSAGTSPSRLSHTASQPLSTDLSRQRLSQVTLEEGVWHPISPSGWTSGTGAVGDGPSSQHSSLALLRNQSGHLRHYSTIFTERARDPWHSPPTSRQNSSIADQTRPTYHYPPPAENQQRRHNDHWTYDTVPYRPPQPTRFYGNSFVPLDARSEEEDDHDDGDDLPYAAQNGGSDEWDAPEDGRVSGGLHYCPPCRLHFHSDHDFITHICESPAHQNEPWHRQKGSETRKQDLKSPLETQAEGAAARSSEDARHSPDLPELVRAVSPLHDHNQSGPASTSTSTSTWSSRSVNPYAHSYDRQVRNIQGPRRRLEIAATALSVTAGTGRSSGTVPHSSTPAHFEDPSSAVSGPAFVSTPDDRASTWGRDKGWPSPAPFSAATSSAADDPYCQKCRIHFASVWKLEKHLTSSYRHPYYCRECRKDWPTFGALQMHYYEEKNRLCTPPEIEYGEQPPFLKILADYQRQSKRTADPSEDSRKAVVSSTRSGPGSRRGGPNSNEPASLRNGKRWWTDPPDTSTVSSPQELPPSYTRSARNNPHPLSPSAAQFVPRAVTLRSPPRVPTQSVKGKQVVGLCASADLHSEQEQAPKASGAAEPGTSAVNAVGTKNSRKPIRGNPPGCPICLNLLINAKEVLITACGHLYCTTCILHYLRTAKAECPRCRLPLSSHMLVPVYLKNRKMRRS